MPGIATNGVNGVQMLLPEEDWDALMIGLVQQKYQLVLGAGASAEAIDRHGNRVMAGAALTEALIRDFNLPRPRDLSLRRVYAAAEGRMSLTGIDLSTYLQDLYTGCQAPAWYRYLVAIPWKYIWTLNIDDVLEHAYRKSYEANARNSLVSLSWTENHRIPSPDQVIAVHLHGKANRVRIPNEPIFDISTYLMATTGTHRWHSIFADAYSDAPTIVIGAALREELDLHAVLERGRLTAREAPSIIVLKELDDFDRDEYKRWGLTAIEATAEEFLKDIADAWPDYALRYAPDKAEAAEQIGTQTVELPSSVGSACPQARVADPRHDFYAGHEPTYGDILDSF